MTRSMKALFAIVLAGLMFGVFPANSSCDAATVGAVVTTPSRSSNQWSEISIGRSEGTLSDDERFGLSYWIELNDASGSPAQTVTDQHAFKAGDRIRLHFKSSADGTISIIQIDSSGTSSVLFPDGRRHLTDDALRVGMDRALPSEKFWFKFDSHPGTEKILVLFARNRTELDRAFPTRPEMDERTTATLIATAKTSAGSKGLSIDAESSELTVSNANGAPLVMEINLTHR
jgi:hypothetical protein